DVVPADLVYQVSFIVLALFFFQAEDGIRDRNVTGVQTCALPILGLWKEERALSLLTASLRFKMRIISLLWIKGMSLSKVPIENCWKRMAFTPICTIANLQMNKQVD